ncbi:MAG TPA: hypothetical protein VFY18_15450, partial [Candidatus Limnocylindrales bacterium]|nr:hypothetical protein [Candidatus Limnocylindrales bacterium]
MTDPVLPVAAPPADALNAGLAALGRHAWNDAFDLLSAADRDGAMSGADLERFAEAAYFTGRAARGIELNERAFKAHLDAGDEIRGAYLAFQIAHDYGMSGKPSIASAWAGR